jgi:hypothetical protein
MDKTKMTEEVPGTTSSKRVMGTVAMAAGIGLLLFVGVMGCFRQSMPNAQVSIQAGTALACIGAGLLGVTVVEKFADKGA